jgi:LmbE family N-acetylglucosaminyl deacetylase
VGLGELIVSFTQRFSSQLCRIFLHTSFEHIILEATLIPYYAVTSIYARSVLVLAPHPDDEVFGCGGALVRHVQAGCPVAVIVLTDGAFGSTGVEKSRVIETREAESCAAAAVLDLPAPTFWRLPDRGLEYGEVLIGRVLDSIRSVGADLIYAPALTEMHPDHRALAMIAVEAVRRLGAGVRLAMYEVGVPLSPNVLMDISDVASRKLAAMHCFASQLLVQSYDEHIVALNRFRTYTLPFKVRMAEAYCLHDGADLARKPLNVFASEYVRQSRLGLPLCGAHDFPLVSVVVRSMDSETLGDALDSISLQTYANIEVVVVNVKGGAHSDLGDFCGRYPLRLINVDGGATVKRYSGKHGPWFHDGRIAGIS